METNNKETANKKKKKFSVKRLLKRIGFGVLIFLGLLIGAAVAIPYFFKDEIMAKVQEEANKNINATVSFDDVNLSLLRSFPNFSLSLKGLEVTGKDDFDGLRLAGIESFNVTLDLMSVIYSDQPIEIKNVSLDQPNLYIKVLKNGKANYDIAIPSTDTTTVTEPTVEGESTDFLIQLESYSIRKGNITYDDGTMPILAKIENLNHSGKGDFTSLIYDLKTKTTADAISVNFDGVKYLNKVKTGIDLDINIDMDKMKFTIGKNDISMNALALSLEGFVAMPGDDINMDLKLGSPSTNFKDLLSMIPAAYTKDFSGVKASGQMTLNGMVKGTLNETSIPAFNFNASAKDANFRYPDLPLGINNINTTIKINSPSSDLDKLTVDVPNFHIEIDKSPFDAKFLLKNPMSDPYIETVAKGTIILDDLAKAFPLSEQGVEELGGTIKANLDTKTRMSYVTEEKYDQVEMKGDLAISNMDYVGAGMPKVTIKDMKMEFTPQNVIVDNFDTKLGTSDLQMSGTLDNILTYFSGTKTMKGVLKVRSNKFDANEWLGGETTETAVNEPTVQIEDTTTVATSTTEVFDKFDFTLDAEFKDVTYDIYHIRNTVGKGHFLPNQMEFEQMSTQVGKSDFYIQGDLKNVFGYLFDGETLGGNAIFRSKFIDANELMAMTSPSTNDAKGQNGDAPNAANTMPIKTTDEELFGKFDVNADVQIDKLIYDTYKITDVKGMGNFKHDVFQLADFGVQIGNSDLKATGVINNAIDWLFYSEQKVDGVFDLSSKFFDLNQFMVATPAVATETSKELPPATPAPTEDVEPFLVPADMEFVLNADFKEVLYDKMKLKNARGALMVKDEAVNMTDISTDVFGGSMKVNGGYDTKDETKPKFDFALNIQDFFLNRAFDQLNTVQAIAPIAEYVEGKFNTTFTINGLLGKDMMPDFKTLNSNGLLETINAVIKGYKPVSDLANKLNVDELKALAVKNTKNTFEVKDGFVSVRPFDVKIKDIEMNIGGKHGIMQDMDYDIKMAIPRSMLEKSKATALVNTGIDFLGGQASKLGLNLKQGETINILVKMLGTISKPNVKVKLLGMDGTSVSDGVKDKVGDELNKIKEDAKAKADSLKQVAEARLKSEEERIKGLAQAKIDSLKKEAEIKAQAELDKIKNKAKAKADEEIKKATDKLNEEAKKKAAEELKKATDKIDEDLKNKAKSELDKLKNKFKNPFGKKKKDQ
ncbi:MAG: AsmA-like C-terminal region-containing protein [Saprospiraceae bacterium]